MPSETVKTTVSPDLKAAWADDADHFDMSQSEFVRTMVQAGRHWFDLESSKDRSPGANPRGNALEDRVRAILREHDEVPFEDIVDEVANGIERDVDAILQSFDDDGLVHHSNVDGYALIEEPHGDD
ncbi:MAG: DUF5805 domain-containing protein [Halobacteriales archaeon]